MSQRDGHRLKSQITERTAQNWSTQRALASKGEVYVTLTQTETDRVRQRQRETERDRERQRETERDRERQSQTERQRQTDRQ